MHGAQNILASKYDRNDQPNIYQCYVLYSGLTLLKNPVITYLDYLVHDWNEVTICLSKLGSLVSYDARNIRT
jgi:hypothetical protein